MLEALSPLGLNARFERRDIHLAEDAEFTLTQIAGSEKVIQQRLGKLPMKIGSVLALEERSILRVAPKQFWVLGEPMTASEGVFVTPLTSSRARIVLEGQRARDVLSAIALIDFHTDNFKPGQFVMTGIHHTPVTIVCVMENMFHIYALRTFARTVWEWLCDVAEGLDHA
jgi:methylglutamate dehydrogenase subunit D